MAILYVYAIFDNIVLIIPEVVYTELWGEHKDKDIKYISAHARLAPNKEYLNFSDKRLNLKTGETVYIYKNECSVDIPVKEYPRWYIAINIVTAVIALIMLFLIIYMPIVFFKTLHSCVVGNIFTRKNIKRIRNLSYCLLFLGIMETYFNLSERYIFSQLVEIEGYKVSYYQSLDYFTLIIAFALMAFSETMKQSLIMKEEQDLTI